MLTQAPAPSILSPECHEHAVLHDADLPDLGLVLPPSLHRAVPARQAEYLAGRYAAHQALRSAGCLEPGALDSGADRAPIWPEGFVGSITHTAGFAAAAVARSTRVRGLGRDTERVLDERVALEIRTRALTPEEIAAQPTSGLDPALHVGLIFSAKESLYKAIAPITGKYFDFHEARTVAIGSRSVRLRLLSELGHGFFAGFEVEARFEISKGLIHTAVELSH